ncbi:chain length-determining protein [Reinekea marinisedimentorum]|uniref:Polysaccharide chain length determinant protein (PEP-CTERM system associated) n=1 Tax=Reinekea marinisedimentorum TaxID=230495 RepID=A0A4R3IGF7_9GAMM|nr:chain length-determining protein [Reinekea marinisedimentorum]TCS44102.1 polysaccharide chain length determinant protein (PEP-CTERM system associated) [Reinekea marinisedimentorum]
MDPTNIRELLHALKVEVLRYRYAIVICFVSISAAVLAAGYLMPKNYSSRVVLYADVTNIIGSLLEGKAEITKIDRAKEARDIIFTDRILRSVAVKSGFSDPDSAIGGIRSRMRISANGDYVSIQYSSSSRESSFNVIDAVTQAFLGETARKKREESQSAYEFIDAQVTSYKSQLEAAEARLKEFSAQNIDVTEQSVSSRVIRYKDQIQLLNLEIQDGESRLASYEAQLKSEPEFIEIETERTPTFEERQLENFELRLADLRLSYLDTHPDIVSLKDQIDALREKVNDQKAEAASTRAVSQTENTAYTALRELINNERADLLAKKNRLANTESLLESEFSNAETVAAKQATYKELTRDYAVTKDVYEDMLKRRESARLSMTLDVEGQGVSYKIHEPASYPIRSDGLQLYHFALAGPILGIAVPFGLLAVLVLVDPRIRSASYMSDNLPAHVNLITTIPMYDGGVAELASKRSLILLSFISLVYLGIYVMFSSGSAMLGVLGITLQ